MNFPEVKSLGHKAVSFYKTTICILIYVVYVCVYPLVNLSNIYISILYYMYIVYIKMYTFNSMDMDI